MPENNNLPKLNPEEQPNNQPAQPEPPKNPIIEIPQEYYDKINQERQEKEEQERQEAIEHANQAETNKKTTTVLVQAIINCLIFFICFYLALNKIDLAIFGGPVIAAILSIFFAIKDKKENNYHTAVLIGGMLTAVIAYVLGLVQGDKADYWMHFALCNAIIAFVSFIVCSIINAVVTNGKEIKALGMIGIVLFFVALVGVPYYFYQKNPEENYKKIFLKTTEVKAETEADFIVKTLKNRYDADFDCQTKQIKVDAYKGRRISQRTCSLVSDREIKITVKSLAYNEGSNQYIIIDNYLDIVKLNDFRVKYATGILNKVGASKVDFFIYPKENCTFIGDCAQSQEYFANYKKEVDVELQYKASSSIDYAKFLSMEAKDIVNNSEFQYVLNVVGPYGDENKYQEIINNILDYLNKEGLKNNSGFEITLFQTLNGDSQRKVYKVKGKTNDDKSFKDAQVIK